MSNSIKTNTFNVIEQVMINADLSKLSQEDRVMYYKSVCESIGLNPMTKPFDYITLNGKLTLYARKDATEQLRKIHKISIEITSRELIDDIYIVTARAVDKDNRSDEAIGAVSVGGLKGDAKANAIMKAETKAKRRVTLSVSGLGMLDETEVASIPGASVFPVEEINSTIMPEIEPDVIQSKTLDHLEYLIESLGIGREIVISWIKKSNVSNLTEIKEKTAQALISKYEKQLSDLEGSKSIGAVNK